MSPLTWLETVFKHRFQGFNHLEMQSATLPAAVYCGSLASLATSLNIVMMKEARHIFFIDNLSGRAGTFDLDKK